ncbi:RNA polymerase sigma factor [Mucilaginibacter galii]|uniref:DNA-directed RNA polymerase sigma-70 factor n=1 Tax=Mucilaginibacter galii TaxID=2005073 RepID=A0A917JC55_9SPHI|nr:sigma-70 family RNA polymerase sigma factor [Mucilaginibacter galii]GGI51750.1 DNA-directed RNA polymerase sigma-70 factor [Mucilaginibacter galii]
MSQKLAPVDEELFTSIKQGNHAAFQSLFDNYWEEAYTLVWKKTGSEDDAKDIVQDLFIYIWNNAAKINLKRSFRSYIFAALKYKIINHYVAANKYAFVDGEDVTDDENLSVLPHLPMETKELEQILDDEIDALPERMKEILNLSRKEGLSISEIAFRLSIAEKTVKNQLSIGVGRLRESLITKYDLWLPVLIMLIKH